MLGTEFQYITDNMGIPIAVILPINEWERINKQDETLYINSSKIMVQRLNEARERNTGFSLKEVNEILGI